MPNDDEDLKAELERLKKENEGLKKQQEKTKAKSFQFALELTDQGAVALYGLGRAPVILNQWQWERIFAKQDTIRQFMEQNHDKLRQEGEDKESYNNRLVERTVIK